MLGSTASAVLGLVLASAGVQASTPLVRSYEGDSFFDRWTYYGNYDNTTEGDAFYANKSVATSTPELTYLTDAGTAIIKVDNTSTVAYNDKRNTIKITSEDTYPVGSVWVLDAVHLPYGCSVWPAFWSYGEGATWPEQGEIDTIEGVNMGFSNRMALHTEDGCSIDASSSGYTGTVNDTSCYYSDNENSGCGVTDTDYNSYGSGFAENGGGAFVTELAEDGISIWFFERSAIPDAVTNANDSIDTSSLGTPSAYWGSSTCDITTFFGDQSLVFDITLCGTWAGVSSILSTTGCSALSGSDTCYTTYVLDSTNYEHAYFEINYLKVYSNSSSSSNSSDSSSSSSGASSNSALGWLLAGVMGISALVGGLNACLLHTDALEEMALEEMDGTEEQTPKRAAVCNNLIPWWRRATEYSHASRQEKCKKTQKVISSAPISSFFPPAPGGYTHPPVHPPNLVAICSQRQLPISVPSSVSPRPTPPASPDHFTSNPSLLHHLPQHGSSNALVLHGQHSAQTGSASGHAGRAGYGGGANAGGGYTGHARAFMSLPQTASADSSSTNFDEKKEKASPNTSLLLRHRLSKAPRVVYMNESVRSRREIEGRKGGKEFTVIDMDVDQKQRRRSIANYASGRVPLSRSSTPQLLSRSSTPLELLQVGVPQHRSISLRALSTSTRAMEAEDVEAIEERERMTPRVQTPKASTLARSKRVLMDLAGKEDIFGQKLGAVRRNSTAALERPSLDQPPLDLSSPSSLERENDQKLEQAILNALNQARANYDSKAAERLVQHYRSPRKLAPLSPDVAPGVPELVSAYPLPSSFTLRGYNTCLFALLQLRAPGKSIAPILELYNELLERDLIPDNTTYGTVIRALAMREQEILDNKAAWDLTKRWGLWLQEATGHTWDVEEAAIRDADVETYLSEGNLNSALKLFRAAALTGQANFEVSTYGSLLAAMALKDSPDLEGMKQIVQFGKESKVQGLVSVYKHLFVAATKSGKVAELSQIWEEFEVLAGQASAEEWGSKSTPARVEGVKRESYEKGFVAFLQVGDLSKAFEIFSRMAESAESPETASAVPAANVNTCGELVVGLAKSGQIDLALEWLDKVSNTPLVQQEQFHRLNVSHLTALTDELIFDGRALEAVSVMSLIKDMSPDVEHHTRAAVQYRIWRGHAALTWSAAKAASPEERDALLKAIQDLLAVYPSRVQPDSLVKHIDILAQAGHFAAIPQVLSLVDKAGNLHPRYLRSLASTLDRVASLEMPFGERIEIINAFSAFQRTLTPVVAESVVQSYAAQRKTGSAQEFGLTQQAAFTLVESLSAFPAEKVQSGDLDAVLEQLMTDIKEIDAGENSYLLRAQQHQAVGRLAEILAFRFGAERAESMLSPVFGDAAKEMVQPVVEETVSESELSSGEVSETATSATSAPPSLTVSEALTRNIDRFAHRNPSITPLDAYAVLRTGLAKQEVPGLETLLNLMDHLARASDEPKVRELYDLAQVVLHTLVRPEAQAQSWYAIENAMLIACCHLGHLEEAGLHRAQIVQSGFAPSSDAYATMIASSKDTTDDALVARELWEEALSMGVKPHLFLYNTIISKLSRARKAESALELFGRMKDAGIKPSSVTYGAVINACCRVGDALSAETLFEEMVSKPNFRPRVPPYNTMMQFYLQTQPNRERVLHYYAALQQARVPPSAHTYKLLLDAYATLSPSDIPSMELVFSRLSGDRGVRVQGTHWASLISGYGLHANDLVKAKEVFESISSTQKGAVQESVVWEAWLNVLSQKATIVELEEAHNKMVTSGVQPTAYVYNVLINGYSRAGNIERAREVFESMGDSVSGVAAPNNHPTLLTSSGHAKPSTKAPISTGVVYREPSTYEAMIRAELACGDRARGEDVLRRMEERGYPVAVFMRGKAALDGEAPRFV